MPTSLLAAAMAALAAAPACVNALHASQEIGYIPPIPEEAYKVSSRDANPNIKAATFQQLIDHENPSLGTFTQRYWYNAEFYGGPGSPVVLNAPGEYAADDFIGYTTNLTLPGVFAQTNGGAALILEHRYWGGSSPYQNLTTETLQYLTLNQSIRDLVHFARNVQLPFDPDGSSRPDKAPWVLSGCSYPGALTAWTHHLAPGTFWAYHCSSAVVQTIGDFWQYFAPIEAALPRNCTADLKRINRYFQAVLTNGTAAARDRLKSRFGFDGLADDDFVSAIDGSLGNWQGQQFYSGYTDIFKMCDYMETTNGTSVPGPEGVGVCQSLKGLARFWREYVLPGPGSCSKNAAWDGYPRLACYDSHNATYPVYTDTSVDNPYNRQWMWFLCNEAFEYWQAGSKKSTVGFPAPLYSVEYWRVQCPLYFPDINGHQVGMVRGARAEDVNRRTGGWANVNTTRLVWVNGEYDPWRSASVASDFRPGGPFVGDEARPSYVIPRAAHCNDMIIKNARVNSGAKKVVDAEVSKMKDWVDAFYKSKV
ncbi:Peptidase S28 [Metarhizium album ARSEF 1941]|uniref:Peptidase S28 n=1 Tax=Metarhizium album (strain ARSEF 1941) TaxID=1081103 RepID=A0A0B2WFS0_METAS|nr:Peptidase S28 [Metarhizium album ARSEF 1941]KHN94776.1 Peptidase S28 [Metarhizium album ARSEF 1941]